VDYLDFELEIQPGTGRDYPIAVLHSPAGEARATMHFPFDQLALESRLDKLKIALLRSGGKRRQLPSDEERPDGMLFDMAPQAPARIAVPEPAEASTSQPAKTPVSEAPPAPSATGGSMARESASNQLMIDRSIHLELARVPAGEFLMGSDKAQDAEAEASEFSKHRLYLPEFLIGKHPVTVAEFEVFVQSTGYKTTAEQLGSGFNWNGRRWQETTGANWRRPRGLLSNVRDKRNHPASQISWLDAQAFCEWASRITGRQVQLPSEAEWEKAARGTDGRRYPWGNESPTNRLCNFTTSFFTLHADTTPVGHYSPGGDSPYGCTDMVGNVLEWTRSLWGKDGGRAEYGYPYQPGDGREDTEAGIDVMRTLRGGSFYDGRSQVRCAVRRAAEPRYRLTSIGFRVAVSPSHS
jgi:formylglycine-generating enzyme